MGTINIKTKNLVGGPAPLYRRYPGQSGPQSAFVEMDEDGNVSASSNGEIGNGVPMYVWHNRTQRWSVPPSIKGDALADLLKSDEITGLLGRIHAGHSVDWDGNNHSGSFDEDATAASEILNDRFSKLFDDSSDLTEVWGTRDWLDAAGLIVWWPDGVSIEEASENIKAEAESASVVLEDEIEDTLLEWAADYWDAGKSGLTATHLDALISDGRIDDASAAEYAEEHGIDLKPVTATVPSPTPGC